MLLNIILHKMDFNTVHVLNIKTLPEISNTLLNFVNYINNFVTKLFLQHKLSDYMLKVYHLRSARSRCCITFLLVTNSSLMSIASIL